MGVVAQCPALRRARCLVECSAVFLLTFLIPFEQKALHFHFALSLANYVAVLVNGKKGVMKELVGGKTD